MQNTTGQNLIILQTAAFATMVPEPRDQPSHATCKFYDWGNKVRSLARAVFVCFVQ